MESNRRFTAAHVGRASKKHSRKSAPRSPMIGSAGVVQQYTFVFVLALLVAFIIFMPFLLMDNGLFVYYGDYNVQQIPFYQICHEAIRTGETGWNWYTDLGSNFIGSYAFYTLGSPFFWLTLPFPNDWVPYLMAPLLMLKMATAAVTSFGYLKRFCKNADFAVLGALMYAFSGYSIYNIFFNHFHEVIAFFPLLLIGMEEFFVEDRRGMFALSVGLLAMVNYYFFFGAVIFAVIYFVICAFTRPEWKVTVGKFLLLAVEAVIGLLLSMWLLFPALMMVLSNPRLDNWLLGWSGLFYGNVQRYGLILSSMFYPPDVPAYPNIFPDSNAKWSSVSLFLPMFSMVGVFAFMRRHRSHWIKKLLLLSLFIALVPFLNSAFSMFNSAYYARWFFMPMLLMCAATVIMLDKYDLPALRFGVRWTLFPILVVAVIFFFPKKEDGEIVFGKLMTYPERFIGYFAIAIAGLLIVNLLIQLPKSKFVRPACGLLSLMICVTSILMMALGKGNETVVHRVMDMGLSGSFETIAGDADDVYRIDTYSTEDTRVMDNFPMYWRIPTIQSFHSCVSGSIFGFYEFLGIDRNVASRPDISYEGLRVLTSCKYLLNYKKSADDRLDIPGHRYLTAENDMDIYLNENYLPMGIVFDHYLTEGALEVCPEEEKDHLLLLGLYLSDEQIARHSDIITPVPGGTQIPVTEELTAAAADKLREKTCDSFERGKDSFTASITTEKESLLFFSVPYESGWSATINGKPAEIEVVNGGMMAIRTEAGFNSIRFDYKTPGKTAGLLITLSAAAMLALYLLLLKRFSRTPLLILGHSERHRSHESRIENIPLETAYINAIRSEAESIRRKPRKLNNR